MIFRTVIFFLILLKTLTIVGQQPASFNFTTEDGLPTNTIYCVHQDSKGYLWFGTENGVSRFNGKTFTNFQIPDVKLSDVYSIFEDSNHKLWFIGGFKIWHFENNQIHPYLFNSKIIQKFTSFSSLKPIKKVIIDSENNFHIFYYSTGYMKIDSSGNIQDIQNNTTKLIPVESNWYLSIFNPPERTKYPTMKITYLYNQRTDTVTYNIKNITSPSNAFTTNFENQPIFSVSKTIVRVSKDSTFYKELDKRIIYIYPDESEDRIYLCQVQGGIKVLDQNLEVESNPFDRLNDYTASCIIKDTKGGFWITTISNGVYYYPYKEIQNYPQKGLIANIVTFKDQILYNEFRGGVYFFNEKNEKKSLEYFSSNTLQIKSFNNKLFCSEFQGFSILDSNNTLYSWNLPFLKTALINDTIFLSSYSDIHYLDEENKFHRYIKEDSLLNRKNLGKISEITGFHDKIIACTTQGLKVVSPDSLIDLKKINSFLENDIVKSALVFNEIVYLATIKSGLLQWHNDSIKQINTENGLISNTINTLAIDKKSNLWIGTNKGLQIFNTQNHSLKSFTIYQGLINNNITSIFFDNNFVLIGTSKGISKIPYALIEKEQIHPPIFLRKIQSAKKVIDATNLAIFPYYDNNISFTVDVLDFVKKYSNSYYRIQGLNNHWEPQKQEEIQFLSIPPGQYTFEVSYFNNYGKRVVAITYPFEISPPFWKTPWFIFVAILVSFLFGLWSFNYLLVKEKNKQKQKNQLLLYQQQALNAKMNPHFIFNSLNSIQYFITFDQKNKASKYLVKFTKLMRLYLSYSENEFTTIKRELELVEAYCNLQQIRFNNEFEYKIIIDPKINVETTRIPTSIVQPIIENSIQHGLLPKENKKRLKISFTHVNNATILQVIDNGIGRKAAQKAQQESKIAHQSVGLNLIEKKLSLLSLLYKKEFSINIVDLKENDKSIGTQVTFVLPIINTSEKDERKN